MSESKRIKNPYPPAETPVQIFKRVKAEARMRPAAIEAGSPAPAASLPSGSGTPAKKTTAKRTRKAPAKKTTAKKAAASKAGGDK